MKKYEKIFNEFIEERRSWEGALSLNPLYLTICYKLISGAHEAGTIKDKFDLMLLYDNLAINNEFLNVDNLEEYDPQTLCKIWGVTSQKYKTIKTNILKNNCIYLLNYYRLEHTEKRTLTKLIYCLKKYNINELLFDNKLNFIGFNK